MAKSAIVIIRTNRMIHILECFVIKIILCFFCIDCKTILCAVIIVLYKKEGINMTTEVRASHLLVQTEEEAKQLREDILNGRKFEDVAAEVSMCPSGANGGDLGFFGRGVMVREFEEVAFSMNVGDLSEPIQTQFGWHLLYLTDKN